MHLTGIDNIMALPFPLGSGPENRLIATPGVILVKWQSQWHDCLHQIYVNGRKTATTCHPRESALLVENEHDHPVLIHVVGVTPEEREEDFSAYLSHLDAFSHHAYCQWLRRGELAWGSSIAIYQGDKEGIIDYSQPIYKKPIWRFFGEKWGWGTTIFGKGDFGYDGAAAPGWGRGDFGRGQFGFDADHQEFVSAALPSGTHTFELQLRDYSGQLVGSELIFSTFIDPIPQAPAITLNQYDAENNILHLYII